MLESLCLVGIVPAMCRMALPAPPGAERLRARAAGFVQQLCFSGAATLQMLIACGGLRWARAPAPGALWLRVPAPRGPRQAMRLRRAPQYRLSSGGHAGRWPKARGCAAQLRPRQP